MTVEPFFIDPDIRRAETLPAEVYRDPAWYALQLDRVFAPSWQLAGDASELLETGYARPFTFLDGSLDEPLVRVRDVDGAVRCLSNVCTHRGNLVVGAEGETRALRCRYHGRRFGLDGRLKSAPEFDGAEDFPREADHLRPFPVGTLGPMQFTAVDPAVPFAEWIAPITERLEAYEWDALRYDPETTRDYHVAANWALYCDNYLEGFHVPFVHPELTKSLDVPEYRVETLKHGVLQIGVADDDTEAFGAALSERDAGKRIAAYYLWLFPNLMLNLYPWGVSVNVVLPLGPDRTRVRFLAWVRDPRRRSRGAGADLHHVELEDEAVVEAVQRGTASRVYRRGRYSPSREAGVHHFHRLLAEALHEA